MLIYECKACGGGPCVLVIEDGCKCDPRFCPWLPEDVAEWKERVTIKIGVKDGSKNVSIGGKDVH